MRPPSSPPLTWWCLACPWSAGRCPADSAVLLADAVHCVSPGLAVKQPVGPCFSGCRCDIGVCMDLTPEALAGLFGDILPHLDERQRRLLLLGAEARALGHGGIRPKDSGRS